MPASASCPFIASASWVVIGVLPVTRVNVKLSDLPPSARNCFALARSRWIGLIELSYAQDEGGIGPFAGTPTSSQTPLTIAVTSRAYATASRSDLLSNGGLVVLKK